MLMYFYLFISLIHKKIFVNCFSGPQKSINLQYKNKTKDSFKTDLCQLSCIVNVTSIAILAENNI